MGKYFELRSVFFPLMGVALLTVLVCSGCRNNQSDNLTPEQKLLRTGKELFAKSCASCHGVRGNGMGARSGPSLQRPDYRYGSSSEEVYTSIYAGRSEGMPAFSSVYTEEQIKALVQYIRYLQE